MYHEAWKLETFQTANCDLQGHSRALTMVPFDTPKPHAISYQCSIATVSLFCTVYEILSLIFQNLRGHVTLNTSRSG